MRILFAGTPEIASPSLAMLVESQIESGGAVCRVSGILTNPDAIVGRRRELKPSAVCAQANKLSALLEQAGFPAFNVHKFNKISAEEIAEIAKKKYDILIAFAYGVIFPPEFLAVFPLGAINIHPSLLPRWRGPSPIEAAILNRDKETGVTIQRIAQEIDSGEILAQECWPLTGEETGGGLSAVVAEKASVMLAAWVKKVAEAGFVHFAGRAQDESKATFCEKFNRQSARIDWYKSAASIDAQIRAFSPGLLCWTECGTQIVNILEGTFLTDKMYFPSQLGVEAGKEPGTVLGAGKTGVFIQCGRGLYCASVLQYQTKKALDFHSFLNGAKNFIGTKLG
ncbi:MAG: methionyl-tRNA formyltransferase [Spirochaetaceae bacterium]|jgi:methionyl-tRNA formyltransferase|nr:methionyl-tRNA formyltransferase [Spirochaetaceae bacterium]